MAEDIAYMAEAALREELDALRGRILANHLAAGQRVTGKTGDSMTVGTETDEGGVTGFIDAAPYFAVLETGSRPWSNQHTRQRRDGSAYPSAPKWFVDIIRQWASDKGLDVDNPWGIATKIMTSGSRLYREGGRTDIFSNELDSTLKGVSSRLGALFDTELKNSIGGGQTA